LVQAVLVGVILSVALGWTLLSAALSLPFLLGLFFFMLFGMVIGAAMFRFAAPARPIAKSRIVAMTAIVTFVCWSVAVARECVEFPEDFVNATLKNKSLYIAEGNQSYERVRGEIFTFIDEYLDTRYPPGGAVGYMRLAAGGQPVELDIPSQPKPLMIEPRVPAWVWWTRMVLSLVLLYVAVYAVTTDLAKERDTPRPSSAAGPETETESEAESATV
jgi:hypothetical protein